MKKKFLKLFSILITIALLLGILAGCTAGGDKQTSNDTRKTDNHQTADSSKDNDETKKENTSGKITDKPITLTYWMSNQAYETDATMGDTPFYKELEKQTGVHIEFLHPPQGQSGEQFNLMLASGDLPDMIEYTWLKYPGGPEKAISDDIILPLNDIINKYAPNLKKYLAANPDVDRILKTDERKYYVFPFIRGADILMVSFGPHIRKDWLNDLGLEIPTTISEWEEVLIKFRDEKNAEAPLTFMPSSIRQNRLGSFILGAYGVAGDFYVDNNEIKFGPIEPGYKEALATLAKWYKEGLLDPDFAAQDSQTFNAKVTGGKTGAFLASPGSGMGTYLTTMKNKDTKFDLSGAPWPTLNKGETPKFGMKDFPYFGSNDVAITTNCKEVEIAAKWLDYGYGEEGHMLFNFGIEGESYEMVNGYPTYTDFITNNPDGLSMAVIARRYMRSVAGGPFVQDERYIMQYLQYPQQREALGIWSDFDDSTRIPPITPNPDESQRLASIMAEVNTYVNENMLKFIMGQQSLDNFDEYVKQIKRMNIDEAIKIQQAALDRYNSR